jgi:radical SAM superfamily enzyme YgiQ (UPF0313 family)
MGRAVKRRDASPLKEERGTIYKEAGLAMALGYPAPYRVGVSSLGAQQVYRLFNEVPGLGCSRFFLPERGTPSRPLVSLETGRPIREMAAIAFSIACERELLGLVQLLEAADLAPLRARRHRDAPPVIIGGPLTMVDPALVAPLADVVAVGDSDHLIPAIGERLVSTAGEKGAFVAVLADECPALWLPSQRDEAPRVKPPRALIPARAATWSPEAELKNLFLVEASRGCPRRCAFCAMSRLAQAAPRYRKFDKAEILGAVREDAVGVGLVGAAVSDHPEIEEVVGHLAREGKRVSLSSIRADRLTEPLARHLKMGGLRTLTVAADGPSERLRASIDKGITREHLARAHAIACRAGFKTLKIYAMVGLPGEEEEDIVELADLLLDLSRGIKVTTTVQTFVPKPKTPLGDQEMLDIKEASSRLALLKRRLKGRVRVLPTSPKWSWVDWKLAHAGQNAVKVAIKAHEQGGNFAAWRSAVRSVL